ncbi:hypothetical protein DNC80_07430 [Flavobacterium sp. SOK18b]|uniref:hypothetical protein n=1 Tax=Flavobacterium sp. SOK18b TaxID=797900 RepID=UPI0015F8B3A8|nr:hypothetical protein [Flavobacterium sp. SOK18b]MBB1193502.1 hypothetical protein [Flavobacterium sp. SOK18b]
MALFFCPENKTFSPSPDGSGNPLFTEGFTRIVIKIEAYSGTTRVLGKNMLLLEKHTNISDGQAFEMNFKSPDTVFKALFQ